MLGLNALFLLAQTAINWSAAIGGPADIDDNLKVEAAKILTTEFSYSEACSDTIAACLNHPEDKTSPRLAGMVLRQLKKERSPDKIREMIKDRGKLFTIAQRQNFDLPKDMTEGSDQALLTIVEFADFQCPFCAIVSPLLKKKVAEANGKLRINYKMFPLKGHERAIDAACAALAASKQGKFFDYHNILYKNRHALTDDDLIAYARQLNLDIDRFNTDRKDPKNLDLIRNDKRLGSTVGVDRTPTLFFNGKRLLLSDLSEDELEDRIAEALELLESDPTAL